MSDILKHTKSRAKRLRSYLASQDIPITHAQSLEAVAKEDGMRDWNTLSATLAAAGNPARPHSEEQNAAHRLAFHVGDRVGGTYRGGNFAGTILGLEKTDGGPVWRIKIQFDAPVAIGTSAALNLTRLRVRLMINTDGTSVNLKGTPDGQMQMHHL
ncbi:glyoxalase superfamily protein [Kordiimonas aestuarii]|uniref:glyoxalase superfamily protein n=1 Tax=Kordiimonas aestuarii TaxID=1005925 RepID=UPI0021D1B277|nr:glyoxalase superfamily protein [Kordiimonas aestuarii]